MPATARLIFTMLAVLAVQLLLFGGYLLVSSASASSPSVLVVAKDAGWSGLVANRINAISGHPLRAFVAADVAVAQEDLAHDRTQAVLEVDPTRSTDTLTVSSAQGQNLATSIASLVGQVEDSQDRSMTTRDLTEPARGDRSGSVGYYLVLSWIVAGFVFALIIGTRDGPLAGRHDGALLRVLQAIGFGVLAGCVGAGLAALAVPSWSGHLAALSAYGTLIVAASAAITYALLSVGGLLGLGLAAIVLLVMGCNPTASGEYGVGLVGPVWRAVLGWTPAGASVTGVRDLLYFGGSRWLWPVSTLVWWLAAGTLLSAVAGANRRRPRAAQHVTR